MKSQIKSLKSDLKSLASTISKLKSTRKSVPNGYVSELASTQHLFRHKHIAYCLIRGRTMEQIEGKNRDNNKPDMKMVEWIMESMKPESKAKLYVIVKPELSKSQQAVQAGHAVAAFLKKNPNTMWSNGTLVYIKGQYQNLRYGVQDYEWAAFEEPDMGNAITAVAAFGPKLEDRLARFELV